MGTRQGRGWWSAVVGTALLGLTIALPVGAQSPSPVASAGPVDGAAVLERALAALDGLLSYRLENAGTNTFTGDTVMTTAAVVVNSPTRAIHQELQADGETGVEWIATGDGGWTRYLGGAWEDDETSGLSLGPLTVPTFALPTLQKLVSEGLTTELVGPETMDGRETLHYRARTIDPLITPPPDAYYRRTMTGTLDLWVDRWQGFLVRSELDMVQRDDYLEDFGFDELRMREVATVTAVDDPANVVEPPDLTLPTRPPGQEGDPALAPMVQQAFDALDAFDSYRITSVGSTLGSESRREITVVNRPVEGLSAVLFAFGRDFIDIIRIGDREWSRPGMGEWSPSEAGDGTCDEDRCTAGSYLARRSILDQGETFTLVEDGALVNGVPTTHLRSTAGAESEETGWVPGSVDLWIATDGGHLVRLATDGQAVESVTDIGGINDPANVIPEPSPLAPTQAPG